MSTSVASEPLQLEYRTPPRVDRIPRLVAWAILVPMIVAGDIALVCWPRGAWWSSPGVLLGLWLSLAAMIGAIAWLLKSTPSYAIRMSSVAGSYCVTGASAVVLFSAAAVTTSPLRRAFTFATTPPPALISALTIPSASSLLHDLPASVQSFCIYVSTAMCMLILRRRQQSVWWACVFAMHPLTVLTVQDSGGASVSILLFTITVALLEMRHGLAAGLAFAALCATTPIAWLLMPFVVRESRGRAGILAAALVASFLITILLERELPIASLPLDIRLVAPVAAGAFIAFALVSLLFVRAGAVAAAYWLTLAVALFQKSGRPTTLILCLVTVPLLNGRLGLTALVWCGTVSEVLIRGGNRPSPFEIVPIFIALTIELGFIYRRRMNGSSREVTSVGAVGMA